MFRKELMLAAIDQAKIAAQRGEVPVGCIISLDQKIISSGKNSSISKNSPVRHAEIEAIELACRTIKNYRLPDTSIYVTLEPCHMCCMAIVNARIKNLYFGAREPKSGSVVSVDNFLDKEFLNHKVSYSGGHMAEESQNLLREFFKNKR